VLKRMWRKLINSWLNVWDELPGPPQPDERNWQALFEADMRRGRRG
jgi:hypothetical protein